MFNFFKGSNVILNNKQAYKRIEMVLLKVSVKLNKFQNIIHKTQKRKKMTNSSPGKKNTNFILFFLQNIS